ncbi:nucleotidyltransferase domain-containing protein [Candidatus Woesearchaeota archaeon]|jgi:predicted nucleotidyltransferase|nr:nucleotidyltransferase domain-containing protein [Candidatus Woesearchaeota archaeon]MBT5740544.1 nucleotidyltransferase domain-containing protein [Candidatus Woesearchaeota archaeon]
MLEIFNTLAYFFEDNYVKISVREFAKFKKISPPHASKLLNFFTREGLLTKEEDRRYHFFQANRENKLFVKLQQAYYTKYLEPLTFFLEEQFLDPVIILFGSFSKGEINENSDIDLAIFSPTKKPINLKKFESKFKREIQLFTFKDRESLNKNKELLHNILNGFLLSGSW